LCPDEEEDDGIATGAAWLGIEEIDLKDVERIRGGIVSLVPDYTFRRLAPCMIDDTPDISRCFLFPKSFFESSRSRQKSSTAS